MDELLFVGHEAEASYLGTVCPACGHRKRPSYPFCTPCEKQVEPSTLARLSPRDPRMFNVMMSFAMRDIGAKTFITTAADTGAQQAIFAEAANGV